MKVRNSPLNYEKFKLFNVGSYLGDVWEFDFSTMLFTEMKLEGPDAGSLNRSNHTAIYYKPHDS